MPKSAPTFFCEDIASGWLGESESAHAQRVLRLPEGAAVFVADGKGRKVAAVLAHSEKKRVAFRTVREAAVFSHRLPLHIAIAPPKSSDRFAFFLEKVTEMGLHSITPILCSRSERRALRLEKAEKTLISALKQSGNGWLPQLHPYTPFEVFVAQHTTSAQRKLIAHCAEDPEKKKLNHWLSKEEFTVILVGPEGDFTKEERLCAKENGYHAVSLGNARLRTETAGILACHTAYLSA